MQEKNQSNMLKATLLLAAIPTVMAGATIAPSLPQMSKVFADTPNAEFLSKLILTLPALFIAIMAPVSGMLIDRFGRLRVLIISTVLYAAAGTTGLYLDDLFMILAGRALLGVAVAGVMTTASTLVGDYFQHEERNKFLALQGSFMALGGMLFLGFGGWLADFSWRSPFLIYFFSLVLIPFVLFFLYEPEREQTGANQPGQQPEKMPTGTIFIIYLTGFMAMAFFYFLPVQIPFLLKSIGVESNSLAGIALATTTLSAAIMSFFYRKAKPYLNYQMIYAIGFLIASGGMMLLFMAKSYPVVVTGMAVCGLGFGWMMPNSNLWLLSLAPAARRGRLVGGLTTAFFIGQFSSPFLAASMTFEGSISGVFLVGMAMSLACGILYLIYASLLKRKNKSAPTH